MLGYGAGITFFYKEAFASVGVWRCLYSLRIREGVFSETRAQLRYTVRDVFPRRYR